MRHEPSIAATPQDEVRHLLIGAGDRLSAGAGKRLRALGEAAVPALLAVLSDPDLQSEDGPGLGWAPIHAARLLGELRAPAAIQPLLDTLRDTEGDDILQGSIACALGKMGEPALEPTLRAYADAAEEHREQLIDVLAELRVRDERVLSLLLRCLETSPEMGAILLGIYGDPAALPQLGRALDRQRVRQPSDLLTNHAFVELRDAIERLGGELTPAQRQKCELAETLRRRWLTERGEDLEEEQPAEGAARGPGRNAPCPCGSGKKFKRCHALLDS